MNLRDKIAVPQYLPLLRVREITDLVWVDVVSQKMRVPLCCEDTSFLFFLLITQTGDLNIDMTPAIIEDRHSGQVLRCYACLRGYHPKEGCDALAALICGAVTVPEVQVNQSRGLNTEPHEHVVLKACLLARPSSGMSLSIFAAQTWFSLLE